jgi:KUP system potassium uptake protein
MSKTTPVAPSGWKGVLLALGIVFGDIGTSVLYALDALCRDVPIEKTIVLGGLSSIFWALTLIVTTKYVFFVLRADNHGEGGVFALYALLRRYAPRLVGLVVIGGAMSFSDSIFTPAISVTSAIEGLELHLPGLKILPIVIVIITALFFIQQFGTEWVGRAFGPITLVWFIFIGGMGLYRILEYPLVLEALNPVYAFQFLSKHPRGVLLLGAVFLTITGVEALYADMGHVGRGSIRKAWLIVKPALLLSYFGQGAWLLTYKEGALLGPAEKPFYAMLPAGWLIPAVIIATAATIIASQATISSAYTIFTEANRLGFWPRMRILYPATTRSQMYVPFINWLLWGITLVIILSMQRSSAMEAAYGLSINIAILVTSTLSIFYFRFYKRHQNGWGISFLFGAIFLPIELLFLYSNLHKVPEGGWIALLLGGSVATVMTIWLLGERIKSRFADWVDFEPYLEKINAIRQDEAIPYYASHLACLTTSPTPYKIEHRLVYVLTQRQPKRCVTYWFLHIHLSEKPFEATYDLHTYVKGHIYRVDFYVGYKLQPQLNLLLRQVVEHLVQSGEVDIRSPYPSLRQRNQPGDFKFFFVRRIINNDARFTPTMRFFLQLYNFIDKLSLPVESAYGLEVASVAKEVVPLTTPHIPPELKLTPRKSSS